MPVGGAPLKNALRPIAEGAPTFHAAGDGYVGMALLPVLPALRRSFSSLTAGMSRRRNGSSLRRHATAAEGKTAHLLFAANLEEPSARPVPVTRYFPARL